ncbi:MAG: GNAT family N-acetyltransferase [Sutterellaceae bacterium]|nr:GNAT family N-acetyltransferase [Burkholderiaceae bacterium]MCX7901542.1 GNAT family N-acetyltransferase [Burkholderiaceae bacterium]MDW8430543.1 GNAT family N-acetyltransferase [Sutterellaceae bacterium]
MDFVRSDTRRYTQLPRFFRWFSAHCVLRRLDESDAYRVAQALSRPGHRRGSNGNLPRHPNQAEAFVRSAQADWLAGSRYVLAVTRKQTQEFVGWTELRSAGPQRWMLGWFVQPELAARPLAREIVLAAADLMFTALNAQALYAECPFGNVSIEQLLTDAGFIEMIPAGSLDPANGRPRLSGLFELGRSDWETLRRTRLLPTALGSQHQPLALV